MREGLFKRYIVTFASMLISCTLLLGLAFLYFSANNYSNERETLLQNTAARVMEIIHNDMNDDFARDTILDHEYATDALMSLHDAAKVTILLTEPDGSVLYCTEGKDCVHTTNLSQNILNIAIRRGSYSAAGYFDGMFRQQGNFVYGLPVMHYDALVGFAFVMMPIAPLYNYLLDMLFTFLISSAAMLLVATVIIYYATRSLIAPLSDISNAARRFGSGDFNARVTVTGNDEIAKLSASFNTMADSITEYENQRRSFVSNVSHELRTPMTTIGGYIDGILDNTIPKEKTDDYLAIVSEEVKRLSRLTTSLLYISRIDEGVYNAELINFNVWDVILPVLLNQEQRIHSKHIQVNDLEHTPCYALCDKDMVHQIVYNLVDNAIKFTDDGGMITVRTETKNGLATILVRNTGAGIPPEEIPFVFDRFYKGDKSRGLDKTGTGLGLFISKSLALKMGGEIAISSENGQWTELRLLLKAGVPEKKEPKAKPSAAKPAAKPVVRPKPNKNPWFRRGSEK